MRDHYQDRLNPHTGEPAQLPDQFAHFGAMLARVEGKHAGLLDRVVIPALSLTMLAQNLQLLRDLRSGLEVAGVSVACDQAQRLLLATTGNQNRRMWPREALRKVERVRDAVVLPLERTLVSLLTMPHAQADLEHLLQPFVALLQWREGQS